MQRGEPLETPHEPVRIENRGGSLAVLDAFDLTGTTAVVTGGNTGLGEAFAKALVEAGAGVALAARTRERSEAVAEEIQTSGGSAIAVDLDVTVHGLWYCAQAVGRRMIQNGGGTIINIGSISAMIVNRPQWQPAYNASKAAVHQLTKSLAAEWAPYNVRVNALAPGYVNTAMAPVDEPQFRRHWIEDAPMQRYATPEELGPSIVYLASDASSFMTGSILVLDGGYTLF